MSFGYSIYHTLPFMLSFVHFLDLSIGLNFPQGQYHELDVVFKTFDEFCAIVKRRGENKEASRQYTLKNKHMSHAFHQS